MDSITTPGCLDCQHWRCGNCRIEEIRKGATSTSGYQHRRKWLWYCCNCNGTYGFSRYIDNRSSVHESPHSYSANPIPVIQGLHSATIRVSWNVLDFMQTQFEKHSCTDIGSVITLTGSVKFAQATSCAAYLQQNWPTTGLLVLETLQAAVNDSDLKAQKTSTDQGFQISINLYNGVSTIIYLRGTYLWTEQVVQQISWIGAALRTSTNDQIEYIEAILTKPNHDPNIYHIHFSNHPLAEEETACWLPLFCNAVIARGFPIRDRNEEIGIDMPVEIMAALGGVKHVVDFEGGLILKGPSTAFVPIKISDGSISWHCIHNDNERRLSYLDVVAQFPNRAMLQDVNFENFKEKRAILGWWPNVEPKLGAKDIVYENMSWSTSPEVKRSLNVSEASFGIQNIGTGELKFSIPAKDNRLRIRREGPMRFQRVVEWSSQLPVLLYDCDDRRGWLVTASDTMLHMAITKLFMRSKWNRLSDIITSLKFADPETHGFDAGRQALQDNRLFDVAEQGSSDNESYLFKDCVFELWSSMECLLDKNIEQASTPGKSITIAAGEKLRGWEFMDIVGDVSTLRQREITISKTNGGWVDLIKDIDAVVLLASGYGDLMTPNFPHPGLCHEWRAVPKNKDYMAAGVPILNMLYTRAGCALSRKHITQSGISWYQSSSLFEPCKGGQGFRCSCCRLQQLVKDSSVFTQQVKPPGQLSERGAVIFGRGRFMNEAPTAESPPVPSFYSQPNIRIDFSTDEIERQSSGVTLASSLRI